MRITPVIPVYTHLYKTKKQKTKTSGKDIKKKDGFKEVLSGIRRLDRRA